MTDPSLILIDSRQYLFNISIQNHCFSLLISKISSPLNFDVIKPLEFVGNINVIPVSVLLLVAVSTITVLGE